MKNKYLTWLIVITLVALGVLLSLPPIRAFFLNKYALAFDERIGTITTFGYSPLRSAVTYSLIDSRNYTAYEANAVPLNVKVTTAMPLYLNTYVEKIDNLKDGRYLFLGTLDSKYVSYNIENQKIAWEIQLSKKENLAGTPIMDLNGKRILLFGTRRNVFLDRGKESSELIITAYSISLFGKIIDQLEIPLNKIILEDKTLRQKNITNPTKNNQCRTAAFIVKQQNNDYLGIGCSLGGMGTHQFFDFGQGYRGFLVFIPMNVDGKFERTQKIKLFFPSTFYENPNSGSEVGIWLSGGAPPILPDGQILFSTGNGHTNPEKNNFGCCIVRLNNKTLGLDATPKQNHYYCSEPAISKECQWLDMDLSSSTPSITQKGQNLFGFALGKDGFLRSFDPANLPGYRLKEWNEVRIGTEVYGSAPTTITPEGTVQVFAYANQFGTLTSKDHAHVDRTLATEEYEQNLFKKGYKKEACLGYILSQPDPSEKKELVLLYSGKVRNDFVALTKEHEFFPNLVRESGKSYLLKTGTFINKRRTPYYEVATLGFLPSVKSNISGRNLRLKPLYFQFSWVPRDFHTTTDIDSNIKDPILKKKSTIGFLYVHPEKENNPCELDTAPPGLKKIYVYSLVKNDPKKHLSGWHSYGFSVNSQHELAEIWRYKSDRDEELWRTSPVLTMRKKSFNPILIHTVHQGPQSYLVVLDAQTGTQLDKIPFFGQPHFSIPLIVDDEIYVTTKEGELIRFSRRLF